MHCANKVFGEVAASRLQVLRRTSLDNAVSSFRIRKTWRRS